MPEGTTQTNCSFLILPSPGKVPQIVQVHHFLRFSSLPPRADRSVPYSTFSFDTFPSQLSGFEVYFPNPFSSSPPPPFLLPTNNYIFFGFVPSLMSIPMSCDTTSWFREISDPLFGLSLEYHGINKLPKPITPPFFFATPPMMKLVYYQIPFYLGSLPPLFSANDFSIVSSSPHIWSTALLMVFGSEPPFPPCFLPPLESTSSDQCIVAHSQNSWIDVPDWVSFPPILSGSPSFVYIY